MGSDIAGDGRGAVLHRITPNQPTERQRARRWCASEALARSADNPAAALAELLDITGLTPKKGEPR